MDIIFKNINDVSKDIQLSVRKWRNNDSVKKYMYTDHNITKKEHLDWLI